MQGTTRIGLVTRLLNLLMSIVLSVSIGADFLERSKATGGLSASEYVSINPHLSDSDIFFLFNAGDMSGAKNAERSARRREKTQESENQARLYVHDVCSLINSNEYGDAIRVTVGGRAFHSSLLDETEEELLRRRMFCSVIVQPATREVSIQSPYLDIVVFRTHRHLLPTSSASDSGKLCVHLRVRNEELGEPSATLDGRCTFNDAEAVPQLCTVRKEIPLDWFFRSTTAHHHRHSMPYSHFHRGEGGNSAQNVHNSTLRISYNVDDCRAEHNDSYKHVDNIENSRTTNDGYFNTGDAIELIAPKFFADKNLAISSEQQFRHFHLGASHEYGSISLVARSNLSLAENVPAPLLILYNRTNVDEEGADATAHGNLSSIRIEFDVDERLEVVSISPIDSRFWSQKFDGPIASTPSPYRRSDGAVRLSSYVVTLFPNRVTKTHANRHARRQKRTGKQRSPITTMETEEKPDSEFVLALLIRSKSNATSAGTTDPSTFFLASEASKNVTATPEPGHLSFPAPIVWRVRFFRISIFVDGASNRTLIASGSRFVPAEDVSPPPVVTSFALLRDEDNVYAIVPIVRQTELINTAVLSGAPVVAIAPSLRVLAVTESGRADDVTARAHCLSAESRLLKVAPSCAAVYVDGTERRGSSSALIHVQYATIMRDVRFRVWFPQFPLTVWLADNVLNQVENWTLLPIENVSKMRQKPMDAGMADLRHHFQSTEIKVLAAFHVVGRDSGESEYLSGDERRLFDVTRLAVNRVESERPDTVTLRWDEKRARLIATATATTPGVTSIRINCASIVSPLSTAVSETGDSDTFDSDCGSAPISVSDRSVSVDRLRLRPAVDVGARVVVVEPTQPSTSGATIEAQFARREFSIQPTIDAVFRRPYQNGVLDASIIYSDKHVESLADVDTSLYKVRVRVGNARRRLRTLRVRMIANRTIELTSNRRVVRDGSTTLTLELLLPAVERANGSAETCDEDKKVRIAMGSAVIPVISLRTNSGESFIDGHDDAEADELNSYYSDGGDDGDYDEYSNSGRYWLHIVVAVVAVCLFLAVLLYFYGREHLLARLVCCRVCIDSVNGSDEEYEEEDDGLKTGGCWRWWSRLFCLRSTWCYSAGGWFHHGYDKLMGPWISRLGSNQSFIGSGNVGGWSSNVAGYDDDAYSCPTRKCRTGNLNGYGNPSRRKTSSSRVANKCFGDVAVSVETSVGGDASSQSLSSSSVVSAGGAARKTSTKLRGGRGGGAAEWIWMPNGSGNNGGSCQVRSKRNTSTSDRNGTTTTGGAGKLSSVERQYSRRSTVELSDGVDVDDDDECDYRNELDETPIVTEHDHRHYRHHSSVGGSSGGSSTTEALDVAARRRSSKSVAISYHGSEISVCIAPHSSTLTVNETAQSFPRRRNNEQYSATARTSTRRGNACQGHHHSSFNSVMNTSTTSGGSAVTAATTSGSPSTARRLTKAESGGRLKNGIRLTASMRSTINCGDVSTSEADDRITIVADNGVEEDDADGDGYDSDVTTAGSGFWLGGGFRHRHASAERVQMHPSAMKFALKNCVPHDDTLQRLRRSREHHRHLEQGKNESDPTSGVVFNRLALIRRASDRQYQRIEDDEEKEMLKGNGSGQFYKDWYQPHPSTVDAFYGDYTHTGNGVQLAASLRPHLVAGVNSPSVFYQRKSSGGPYPNHLHSHVHKICN